jgi:hypothetical protein
VHTKTTASSAGEWGFEATLEPGWNVGHDRQNAASWAIDRGYVAERQPRGERLLVPWEDWHHVAQGPTSTDAEDSERWAFEHESLASLLGIRREHLHLEAVGHVGGAHLQLRVVLNGGAEPRSHSA